MGDLLFFYNVCKNNNFPQSSEFPESCFNFVQDTVLILSTTGAQSVYQAFNTE